MDSCDRGFNFGCWALRYWICTSWEQLVLKRFVFLRTGTEMVNGKSKQVVTVLQGNSAIFHLKGNISTGEMFAVEWTFQKSQSQVSKRCTYVQMKCSVLLFFAKRWQHLKLEKLCRGFSADITTSHGFYCSPFSEEFFQPVIKIPSMYCVDGWVKTRMVTEDLFSCWPRNSESVAQD